MYSNRKIYPVRMEMTGTKQITISHVCSTDKRKSEELLVDKMFLQLCYTNEEKSKTIIVDGSSTKESESECVHKKINKEKDANNEADNEEHNVTYYPVVKEPRHLTYSNVERIP